MNSQRLAALISIAVFAVVLVSRPAVASDSSEMVATEAQFLDGFNTVNAAKAAAACTAPASIIDDFPPHHWQGPTACADWFAAFLTAAKAGGYTNNVVTMGKPWHAEVDGNTGYVVVPTTYSYKLHGKPTVESGAVWTLAMKKTPDGWRIAGWAWAQH